MNRKYRRLVAQLTAILFATLFASSCGMSEDIASKIDEYANGITVKITATPTAGSFSNDAVLTTITTNKSDAEIRYTVDGTTPDRINGTLYTAPDIFYIPAALGITVKAVAYNSNDISRVASYTIVQLIDGSRAHPYEIATATHLKALSDSVNDSSTNSTYAPLFYRQVADIDLSTQNPWIPIGTSSYNFTGNYDGGNHTITGLTVNRSGLTYNGFFGYVESTDGTYGLINIRISGATITGGANTGALAGCFYKGKINSCVITSSTVTGTGVNTGGMAGYIASSTSISRCRVEDTTIYAGGNYIGGLIGLCEYADTTISDCHICDVVINSSISGASYIGGFAGEITGDSSNKIYIEFCSTTAIIDTSAGPSICVGGLIGIINIQSFSITNCYSNSSFKIASGGTNVGGFAGYLCTSGTIEINDCYSRSAIETSSGINFGGFFGHITQYNPILPGTISMENCYSSGAISGGTATNIGGFGGYVELITTTYTNCFWLSGTASYAIASPASTFGELTETEMKTSGTYISAGWNFTSVWRINSSINDGYPYLIDNPPQ